MATTDSPFDDRYCGNIGPRVGSTALRCVLPAGHMGDHQPHESWSPTSAMGWSDISPAEAQPDRTGEILDDLMLQEDAPDSLLRTIRAEHCAALKALAAAGYSVVRLDVDDLAHIIRTADGDRLARSDELAQAIVDALGKEA